MIFINDFTINNKMKKNYKFDFTYLCDSKLKNELNEAIFRKTQECLYKIFTEKKIIPLESNLKKLHNTIKNYKEKNNNEKFFALYNFNNVNNINIDLVNNINLISFSNYSISDTIHINNCFLYPKSLIFYKNSVKVLQKKAGYEYRVSIFIKINNKLLIDIKI